MFIKQEGQSTSNAAVADFVRFPLLPAAAASGDDCLAMFAACSSSSLSCLQKKSRNAK
jgi:hypothetical protein